MKSGGRGTLSRFDEGRGGEDRLTGCSKRLSARPQRAKRRGVRCDLPREAASARWETALEELFNSLSLLEVYPELDIGPILSDGPASQIV